MKTLLCVLSVLLFAATAHADPIPDYVLQKDYDNCMGGQTAQQDSQRAQYCSCVRNGMRDWDDQTYAQMLIQQAQTQEIAEPIKALAKACVEKVMR